MGEYFNESNCPKHILLKAQLAKQELLTKELLDEELKKGINKWKDLCDFILSGLYLEEQRLILQDFIRYSKLLPLRTQVRFKPLFVRKNFNQNRGVKNFKKL